jgi:hypothetical protein
MQIIEAWKLFQRKWDGYIYTLVQTEYNMLFPQYISIHRSVYELQMVHATCQAMYYDVTLRRFRATIVAVEKQ